MNQPHPPENRKRRVNCLVLAVEMEAQEVRSEQEGHGFVRPSLRGGPSRLCGFLPEAVDKNFWVNRVTLITLEV